MLPDDTLTVYYNILYYDYNILYYDCIELYNVLYK